MTSPECVEKQDVGTLMLGLDEAGKTTILYKLKLGGDFEVIPTIGYNVETVDFGNENFTIWDIGGRENIRTLWKFYTENKAAVVFVVDASNCERFGEAREFLHTVMEHEDLKNAALLVVSNKRDLRKCCEESHLMEILDLKSLKQPFRIVSTSVLEPDSLNNILVNLKDRNSF